MAAVHICDARARRARWEVEARDLWKPGARPSLRQATNTDPVSNKGEGEAVVVVRPEHQYGGMSASVHTRVCAPHTHTQAERLQVICLAGMLH